MNIILQSAVTFLKRKTVWISLLVIVVIVGGWLLLRPTAPSSQYFTVTRGEVKSEVSITGTVKPIQNLDLAFEKGGRITALNVTVGDKVYAGEVLASLDNSDLQAQLAQAQANVKSQQATLDQLKNGTRPEDIQISRTNLQNAQQGLTNAYASALNVLNDAYAKADDAVQVQTDGLFINDNTDNPQWNSIFHDSQDTINALFQRVLARNTLNAWNAQLQTLSATSTPDTIMIALSSAQQNLSTIRNFLNSVMNVLNEATYLDTTTLSAFKTSVDLGRTNVNLASTSVTGQIQSISNQIIAVQQAQDQLNLKLAGSTAEQIAAQEALVEQAQASVSYEQSQISKGIITAPFAGTITKVVPSVGDIITSGDPQISLIGSGNFEIDTNIAESDIAKIQIGQKATVTLDAYGPDVVFGATVVHRDLSETILDGVATYKTTLQFDQEDSRILTGLTANVDIAVADKTGVLYVPTRDIIDDNGNKFVLLLIDPKTGATQRTQIVVGLRGSDGNTEVVSGLSEGDKIVSE